MLTSNIWLIIIGFFFLCFIIVIIIITNAPEYIEDENGNLISKKDYDEIKNREKKKK